MAGGGRHNTAQEPRVVSNSVGLLLQPSPMVCDNGNLQRMDQEHQMGLPSAVRVYGLLILSACNVNARADAALDAELEAEWGDKRVKTVTVESPADRYAV